MYDSRRWIEAHKPPQFVDVDGTTFTGRLWSHVEQVEWKRVFRAWLNGKVDDGAYEGEIKKMLASMGFSDDAVARMLKLPHGAFEELLQDFFVCQGLRRPGASTPEPLPPSNPEPTSPTTTPASPPSAS
jgi:hypothetical protein